MPTIFQSIFAKATVTGVLALIIMTVASTLALTDRIDGPSYLGLALVVAAAYFKSQNTDK